MQTQKFETIVVANSYKNAPSLRLRIFRNWPELSIPGAGQKDRELWGREWTTTDLLHFTVTLDFNSLYVTVTCKIAMNIAVNVLENRHLAQQVQKAKINYQEWQISNHSVYVSVRLVNA